ncbi:sensor histidine kinase [Crossiella cryophila]|uniref:histidine kinase n=1 Tax=Crossiella cryophila TaxID=43355 RepID=A0A7W7C5F9_9PSEU|nr:histidine kinase [Crossiella cryophila]MBB4674877.1 signal transduction histidine kinase [Crossiella cryophila]
MRRLSLWLRSHPMVGDTALVLVLTILDMAWKNPKWDVTDANFYSVGALLTVPLIVRRRQPMVAAGLIVFAEVLRIFTHPVDMDYRIGEFGIPIMLYTLAVYSNRTASCGFALAIMLVNFAILLRFPEPGPPAWSVFSWFAAPSFAWLLGEIVAARRALNEEAVQRLLLLELERDQQAKIAVAQERTRIARELHDVVAHAVSVMVVQADGASYMIKDKPELAERSLKTISATGRQALNELRRLLGVLRTTDEHDPELTPQPSAGQVEELVAKVRAVGLPVQLELRGDLDELPAGIGLGVYRIVQESLTNTIKHGGAGVRAIVRVYRGADAVQVQVLDSGSSSPGSPGPELVSGGNGLIGMQERASVFGGELEAGPRPNGGWQVFARLPLTNRAAGS